MALGVRTMPTSNGARRSERVSFAIPITISGKDANGRPFKEVSLTLVISKNGGLIITFHKLEKGSQIVIENPALSRTAIARVVWVSQGRSPDIPFEAGVELAGASYLWPVEFPPVAERGEIALRPYPGNGGVPDRGSPV